MESEIVKDSWVAPRTKANPPKEEDTAAFSAWEEDFQDLSGWCMDTFQAQCDFRIGESTTFKLSGTKYEGKSVSTVEEEGILKGLRSTTDDKKWDLKMDMVKTIEEPSVNRHLLLSPSELINKYEKGNEENYASSSWLMSPESTASTSTSSSKQHNADVNAPLQPDYRKNNDLEYTCPTSFDSTASHRDTWDDLRTIETIGSDTFDLLSYLCDDEIRSPEGSVSTDSSAMSKLRPLATPSSAFSTVSTKVKTEESNEAPTRRRMETRASSTVTSSTLEAPVTSSRRSDRTKAMAVTKEKEKTAVREKRERNGRKRYYESESEEDVALLQYRECREKNNEASRKSRMNKKAKESEMAMKASGLERDNRILKMKVDELEKLVTSMRSALLRSALKKEF